MTKLKISKKNQKIFDPHGKNTDDSFEALRDPEVINLKQVPCTVNGEKSIAIVAVIDRGLVSAKTRAIGLRPLYVSVTKGMVLMSPEGEVPETHEDYVKRTKLKAVKKGGANA